jgi:heterodisulfide reductase subunit C
LIKVFLLGGEKRMELMDLGASDQEFISMLVARPETSLIWACFTCRTCTVSCPITVVNPSFDPVKIIRKAAYGLKESVLEKSEIWLCTGCYACQERCPQKVPITDFMTLLKNIAYAEGHGPPGVRLQRDTVLKGGGRIYPIDEFDNKKRLKAGLPELPVSCEAAAILFPGGPAAGGSEPETSERKIS